MKVDRFIAGPVAANCYVVETGKETVVIDCGEFTDEIRERLDGVQVKYILLTHGHADHTLGVFDMKQAHPEAQVFIHESEVEYLTSDRIHKLDAETLSNGFGALAPEVYMGEAHYLPPDGTVKEGDVLPFGDTEIQVLHTPGHSMGSVCYFIPSERTIFTGDTLFCLTVGRTDLYGGSDEAMLDSITRLYKMMAINDIYPGHNRETTMDYEKRRNRFMRRFR